jgi:hypothetical protein
VSTSSDSSAAPRPSWRQRLFPNWHSVVWPLVYVATVFAFLGWYELWPRVRVHQELQGIWQSTTGKGYQEKALPAYWHIAGNQTRFYSKRLDAPDSADWDLRKSTISVRPSRDFYVVTRNYSFGKPGRSYNQENVICMREDKFYMINGIGEISGAQDYLISMLRRAEDVPASLQERIASEK